MGGGSYTVGLARREHVGLLAAIERAAAAGFPDHVLTPEIRAGAVPVEQLESAQAEGSLWTAVTSDGRPVGFATARRSGDAAFLQEVDVHPAHQRRGLGRKLVGMAIAWAKTHRLHRVELTTFEHVPWNAPFYSRMGFQKVLEKDGTSELLELLETERRQGLRERVAMQLLLGP